MEQTSASSPLTGAVQSLASDVVSVLRDGGHGAALGDAAVAGAGGELALAAVRVLGADCLLPAVLVGGPPDAGDLAVFDKARRAYPPAADAATTSHWSHWAMTHVLVRLEGLPPQDAAEPETAWLEGASWQALTRQLAGLAALAVPGVDSAVARKAQERPVDVARGFVRAVRRRDWLQAAGAGRWLAVLADVPETLGLDAGLDFVMHMGGADARVALHVHAAQLIRGEARA
ncbi:hypothetical protein AB0M29_14345 [Streptomyces sp. NPDC051976]|uniref:hypothetical protein n=1 Tax=Streptomyces sp. NPDC051976 TaxID=3154947 RepID=UPI00343E501A